MRICDVTFGDNGGSAGLVGVEVVLLQQLLLFLHTTGYNGWSGWSRVVVLLQLLLLFLLLVTIVGLLVWLGMG